MSKDKFSYDAKVIANAKREVKNGGRLIWELFTHKEVPIWVKMIPAIAFLYWLNPIDPLPPPLNMMPLDDMAAVWFGLKLFVELSPQELVNRLRYNIAYGTPINNDEVIDTTYQVLDDE